MFVDLRDVKVRVYLNAVKELNLCREVWSPALNQHNLKNADYYREVVKYYPAYRMRHETYRRRSLLMREV